MSGLPFLPGNTFSDPSKTNFHLSHTLNYNTGYAVPKPFINVGVGGFLNVSKDLSQSELDEIANMHPQLIYGKAKQFKPSEFIPSHVAFDKKVLRFYGYFKETVAESINENYRVRSVIISYFLEDDSMQIYEPHQNNSGLPQGVLIRRQRFPKNDFGDKYSWKDINIGQNLTIYGKVIRITNCDKYTKEFLESEGIVLNAQEIEPLDPYLEERVRKESIKMSKTPSSYDKRRQCLEQDKQVLRFYAVWDDRVEQFGDLRKLILQYYLADDTMEVREQHRLNDGRDPFPVLIRRHRIPKDRDNIPCNFPLISMDLSEQEIKEFFSPRDLRIGSTIMIYGRAFLLHDCDSFTKAWYHYNYGLTEFKPVNVEPNKNEISKIEIPPYNGYGSLEDSLASIKSVLPSPPKVDFSKQVDYATKILRYQAKLDSGKADDALRSFIISYRLGDDMISIHERSIRNSGFPGGNFLTRSRIAKPGSEPEKPVYYGPADFYIGSRINIFGTWFIITDADEYVLKFMEANREQFSDLLIDSWRSRMVEREKETREKRQECLTKKGGPANIQRTEGDLKNMVQEFEVQMRKNAITDHSRIDAIFLKYNKDRLCYLDIENLKEICQKLQLLADEDVLNCFLDKYGENGRLTLDQFRNFLN